MVMALPLTLGLLCGGITRGMRHVKPTVRDRLLWLSSREANRLVLLGGCVGGNDTCPCDEHVSVWNVRDDVGSSR